MNRAARAKAAATAEHLAPAWPHAAPPARLATFAATARHRVAEMKNSHYTTPRTMADCQFAHNADPIELPPQHMDFLDKFVVWACVIALLATLAIIFWP
ncbi:hypothetical protein D3C72_1270570 [compost metagenome]